MLRQARVCCGIITNILNHVSLCNHALMTDSIHSSAEAGPSKVQTESRRPCVKLRETFIVQMTQHCWWRTFINFKTFRNHNRRDTNRYYFKPSEVQVLRLFQGRLFSFTLSGPRYTTESQGFTPISRQSTRVIPLDIRSCHIMWKAICSIP